MKLHSENSVLVKAPRDKVYGIMADVAAATK